MFSFTHLGRRSDFFLVAGREDRTKLAIHSPNQTPKEHPIIFLELERGDRELGTGERGWRNGDEGVGRFFGGES